MSLLVSQPVYAVSHNIQYTIEAYDPTTLDSHNIGMAYGTSGYNYIMTDNNDVSPWGSHVNSTYIVRNDPDTSIHNWHNLVEIGWFHDYYSDNNGNRDYNRNAFWAYYENGHYVSGENGIIRHLTPGGNYNFKVAVSNSDTVIFILGVG